MTTKYAVPSVIPVGIVPKVCRVTQTGVPFANPWLVYVNVSVVESAVGPTSVTGVPWYPQSYAKAVVRSSTIIWVTTGPHSQQRN